MRPTICGRATTTSHPSVTQTTGASQIGALCQTSFASGGDQRPAPRRREERHPPARVHDEQPDRRIRARDERVDHRMVEPPHPKRCARRPREAVEQTADAEHRRDAHRERDRCRARDDTVRGQRQARCRGGPRRRTPADETPRGGSGLGMPSQVVFPSARATGEASASISRPPFGRMLRPRSPVTAARRLISRSPALQGAQGPELLEVRVARSRGRCY